MIDEAGARWGATAALLALLTSLLGSLVISAAFAPFADPSGGLSPLWVRYGSFLLSQLATLGCVLAAVWFCQAPPGALSVRPMSQRGVWEAILGGSGLVGLTALYGLTLEQLWPSAYQQMVDEQARQLLWLSGSWPLLWFSAVIVAPICEESMFRGVVFGGLRRSWGAPAAALVSSLLFAVVHVMPLSMPPLFAIGLASAALYMRHRSLLPSLVLHATYNTLSLLLG